MTATDPLREAAKNVSLQAEVLWEPVGGQPVEPYYADLCQAILDLREALAAHPEKPA